MYLESINWMVVVCVCMGLAFRGCSANERNGFGGQLSPDSVLWTDVSGRLVLVV